MLAVVPTLYGCFLLYKVRSKESPDALIALHDALYRTPVVQNWELDGPCTSAGGPNRSRSSVEAVTHAPCLNRATISKPCDQ